MAFSPNVFHQQQNWLKPPIFYPTFQHKYFEQPCLQHTDYCVSWSDCNLFLHDIILFEILRCRSLSTVTCQILCTGMTLVLLLLYQYGLIQICKPGQGGLCSSAWQPWAISSQSHLAFLSKSLASERVNSFIPCFSHQQLFSNWVLSTVLFHSAICHHKIRKRE